mgnify:CR=1 FL=1|jgi:hypothetical protein
MAKLNFYNNAMETFGRHHETLRMQESNEPVNLSERVTELSALLEELQSQDFLPKEEIQTRVEAIAEQGQSYLVMRQMLERIEQETNYLHEWIETGMYQKILEDDMHTGKIDDVSVFWGSKIPKLAGRFMSLGKLKGAFVKKEEPPDPAKILKKMANTGFFPNSITLMAHERIHGYQTPETPKETLKKILEITKINSSSTELKEAQAYRTANLPIHGNPTSHVREAINPTDYPGIKQERVDYSISAIEKLNALGLTPEEVSTVVKNHGNWDTATKTFRGVEKEIKRLQTEKNISDEDLQKIVIADTLERSIERLRCMRIAQEEIMQASE